VVSRDSKGFFASGMLTQSELSFVKMILKDFNVLLDILLEKR